MSLFHITRENRKINHTGLSPQTRKQSLPVYLFHTQKRWELMSITWWMLLTKESHFTQIPQIFIIVSHSIDIFVSQLSAILRKDGTHILQSVDLYTICKIWMTNTTPVPFLDPCSNASSLSPESIFLEEMMCFELSFHVIMLSFTPGIVSDKTMFL